MKLCYSFFYFIGWAAFVFSCSNLEQDAKVDLPAHESQLVVECYLEPGKSAKLLLTESSGYFDSPKVPFVNGATVTITYNGIVDTLSANNEMDENDLKIYNYISKRTMPLDYENEFLLYVEDQSGRVVTGKTKLTKATPLDSVVYRYKDSLAYVLASFHQNLAVRDYYRIIIHKDSLSNVIQNFTFSDEFSDTEKISIGTGYEFKKGMEAFVTLYTIDKSYYDYLQSVEAARSSNGNPFAQSGVIRSNVTGGFGIFTGLSYSFMPVSIQ
jgi:hypothetical protein